MPVGDGYAPYVRRDASTEDLAVRLYGVPAGAQFAEPVVVTMELYHPQIDYGNFAVGSTFSLVEGTRAVADGRIIESSD